MLDEKFAESIVHLGGHVVLGRRLRPYSFWHALLLDAVESPYAGYNRPLDLATLDTAARVCQLRFPRTLCAERFPCLRACWRQYRHGRFLARERKAFVAYLWDYNSSPVYGTREQTDDDDGGGAEEVRVPCTPWHAMCVELLRQADSSLTNAQAWDAPVGFSRWRILARQEANGARPLIETPEIRAAFAEAGY